MDTAILKAQIIRDKYTKAASFRLETEGNWSLYAGDSFDSINHKEPILIGNGSGVYPLNVSTSIRIY
ncbi:MAG: protein-tyrosine-phosphatase, partial [Dysgonomonas mossii]|nr:protein-tyrosine-phosphatase [Dysgonomonas mossii]